MFLQVDNVKKVYGTRLNPTVALRSINFEVDQGEFVAIMGESGSGKSTLLNIIASLDSPSQGRVILNGTVVSDLADKDQASFRRNKIGFVFQDFNLLDTLSNRDNILLPLVLSNVPANEVKGKEKKLASILDIEAILDKYPYQISGGQKQRVAIARALITGPEILLADEPTGALDSKTSTNIMEIFTSINKMSQTVLMVTHSIRDASYASRVLFIKDGIVYHEIYKGDQDRRVFEEQISKSLAMLNTPGESYGK